MAKRTSGKRPAVKSPTVYFAIFVAIVGVVFLVIALGISLSSVVNWGFWVAVALGITLTAVSRNSPRLREILEYRKRPSLALRLLDRSTTAAKNCTSILFPLGLGYLLLGQFDYVISPWLFYLSAGVTLAVWLDVSIFEYRVASGKYCGIDREARELLSFIVSGASKNGSESGNVSNLVSRQPTGGTGSAPGKQPTDVSGALRKGLGFLFAAGAPGVCYGMALGIALAAGIEGLIGYGILKYSLAGLPAYCVVFGLLVGVLIGYLNRRRLSPDLETAVALISDRKAMGALSQLQAHTMFVDLCQRTLTEKTAQTAALQTTI